MTDFRRGSSFGHAARSWSKPLYTVTRVVDFSLTPADIGTHELFFIPANTKVIDANVEVLKAETVGTTGTIAYGDTDDDDRYVTAAVITSPGYMTGTGVKGLPYATTGKNVTFTVATAKLEDGKVKFSVTFADLS